MDQKSIFASAKTIRLSAQENDAMRAQILRYTREHPAREAGEWFPLSPAPRPLEWLQSLFMPLRPVTAFSVMFAVVLALGTSLSVAAQSALPGDFLYPIKVHVNENVEATLHASSDSRAQFETQRLANRLEEAATLAASGRLNGHAKTAVSDGISAQLARVQTAAETLAEHGNPEAALDVHSQVESVLIANATILGSLADTAKDSGDVRDLLKEVSQAEHDAAKSRAQSEEKISEVVRQKTNVRVAGEGSVASAARKIDEVRSFIDQSSASADAQVLEQAAARFSLAKKFLGTARDALDEQQWNSAFSMARTSMRTAQEAKIMMKISADVRERLGLRPSSSMATSSSLSSDTSTDDDRRENDEDGKDKKRGKKRGEMNVEIHDGEIQAKPKDDGEALFDVGP